MRVGTCCEGRRARSAPSPPRARAGLARALRRLATACARRQRGLCHLRRTHRPRTQRCAGRPRTTDRARRQRGLRRLRRTHGLCAEQAGHGRLRWSTSVGTRVRVDAALVDVDDVKLTAADISEGARGRRCRRLPRAPFQPALRHATRPVGAPDNLEIAARGDGSASSRLCNTDPFSRCSLHKPSRYRAPGLRASRQSSFRAFLSSPAHSQSQADASPPGDLPACRISCPSTSSLPSR